MTKDAYNEPCVLIAYLTAIELWQNKTALATVFMLFLGGKLKQLDSSAVSFYFLLLLD